jgi:hypothetical protein
MMRIGQFSKREALSFGWGIVKRHLGYFLLLYLLYAVVIYLPINLVRFVPRPSGTFQLPLMVFLELGIRISLAILMVASSLGFARIGLKLCDNEPVRLWDLFSVSWRQIFRYFLASFAVGLLVGLVYLPLIIPVAFSLVGRRYLPVLGIASILSLPLAVLGIIVSIRFSKFPYFIVDSNAGSFQALKGSWVLTKHATWDLFLFMGLLLFVNVLGALTFGVGLLATLPTTLVAHAFVYRKLQAGQQILASADFVQPSSL